MKVRKNNDGKLCSYTSDLINVYEYSLAEESFELFKGREKKVL